VVRESVVGIATRYGLNGTGIESRRSQWPSDLKRGSRPIACWDCGFESRWRRGCLCCRVSTRDKGEDSQDKEVRIKYEDRTKREKSPCGGETFRTRPADPRANPASCATYSRPATVSGGRSSVCNLSTRHAVVTVGKPEGRRPLGRRRRRWESNIKMDVGEVGGLAEDRDS
jgi:hypothetical protein